MAIKFDSVNKIVLDILDFSGGNMKIFNIIGKYYYKFLTTNQYKLNLQIPNYNPEIVDKVYEYIRILDLTYKLINKPDYRDFSNTCIFDIFSYKKNIRNLDSKLNLALEFKNEKNNVLHFGEDTIAPNSRFLPLFITDQITEISKTKIESISNSFKLFSAIKNSDLINYPILIDLESDLTLSITDGKVGSENNEIKDYTLLENYPYKKRGENRTYQLIESIAKYKNLDVNRQILFKYPSNNNIDSRLNNIIKNYKIEVKLQNRLFYKEIKPEDIIFLPSEINEKIVEINSFANYYEVLDSGHHSDLYFLLKDFKEEWEDCGFFIYTTPFPIYWFMCIHKVDGGAEVWINRFKESYPVVAENRIISKIEAIIEKIYSLNWIDILLNKKQNIDYILLPKCFGSQIGKLYSVFVSVKSYIKYKKPEIKFISHKADYCYEEYPNLLILDAFKKDELSNINSSNTNINCTILAPDFLYFNFRPWIKYHVVNNQAKVLINEARKILDENFERNQKTITIIKKDIIENIKKEFLIYKNKYEVNEIMLDIEGTDSDEDLNPTNEEENEYENSKVKSDTIFNLLVETEEDQIFELTNKSKILIQRNTMINSIAETLNVGEEFIPIDQINSSLSKGILIEKLSKVNDSAKIWQVKLNELQKNNANLYSNITNRGLDISLHTFEKRYLISETKRINVLNLPTNMPKTHKNWDIICNELEIDNTNKHQAWIAYYGRKQITKLKDLYRIIIKKMYEEDYFGEEDNSNLIKEIENILRANESLFKIDEIDEHENTILVENEMNFEEVAKSLIISIHREITLVKVKKITKTINHE